MEWTQVLRDILMIAVPAAVVLMASLYMMKGFFENENRRKVMELRSKNQQSSVPVRLQAYERMILLLERISPNNLLLRVPKGNLSAHEYQSVLLSEIRAEYDHNLSQQLYISIDAWNEVKNAREDLISVINSIAKKLPEEARAIDLSRAIFDYLMQNSYSPTEKAIRFIKFEAQTLF